MLGGLDRNRTENIEDFTNAQLSQSQIHPRPDQYSKFCSCLASLRLQNTEDRRMFLSALVSMVKRSSGE